MKGKMIIDYEYVWNESKELFNDHKVASQFDKCRKNDNSFDFIHAKIDGLQSTLMYECLACKYSFEVQSEPHDDSTLNSNDQIILGCYMIGIGFWQLEYLFASINVQCMSYYLYSNAETIMGFICTKVAYESIIEAGEESKKAALQSNRVIHNPVDSTSIPYTDVITDGCWGKRSYSSGLYNSASGMAVAVDFHTRKVLDFGVANKRCFQCQMGTKASHTCWRNYDFNKSSTSMETNIVLDIFRTSLDKHRLIYKNLICDGDSSVYRTLQTARVYRDFNIDVNRTLCSNHLLRRLSTNLVTLSKSPGFSHNNSMKAYNNLTNHYNTKNRVFPFSKAINMRNLITDNTGKTVKTIRSVSSFWREKNNMIIQEQIAEFTVDLRNMPYHIFGHHNECREHYCTENDGYDYTEYLIVAGVWNHELECFVGIIAAANDVLLNYNNNIAESFNSVVNRVLGGDRIDFSKLSRSYSFRICCTIIHFNSSDGLCQIYRSIKKDIPEHLKYVEDNRQRKKNLYNLRDSTIENYRRHYPQYKNCRGDDAFYGPGSNVVFRPVENFEALKEDHKQKLLKYQTKRNEIQLSTVNQSGNPEWHNIRRSLLTASHFKQVCAASKENTMKNIVKAIVYPTTTSSAAMNHGKVHENIARESLAAELNTTIENCGLFIDDEILGLGASPDGLIDDDGLVEIKCPWSLRNEKIADVIRAYDCKWVQSRFDKKGVIKPISDFYHQIQGQLHITKRKYCWLGIWTFKGLYKVGIDYDNTFWINKMQDKLVNFYWNYLVPEILNPKLQHKVQANNEKDVEAPVYVDSRPTADIEDSIGCRGLQLRWSLAPIVRLRPGVNELE